MSFSLDSLQDCPLFDTLDSTPTEQGRTKLLVSLVAGLAFVALCLASYLTWSTWTATPIAGCDGTGLIACDHVLSSPWSKWLGLPVSLFGVLVYIGILAACGWVAKGGSGLAWTALMTLSLMAAGSALWFIGLQVLVLGHFCLYCMGAHACGLAIGVLMIFVIKEMSGGDNSEQMRMLLGVVEAGPASADNQPVRSGFYPLAAAGASALGLAILMTGQFFVQPAGLVLEEVTAQAPPIQPDPTAEAIATETATASLQPVEDPQAPSTEPTPPSIKPAPREGGETVSFVEPATEATPVQEPPPEKPAFSYTPPRRVIAFKGLNEAIDVYKVPILGSPKAKHIVVEMFDYTCSHCRHFHPNVQAALDRYGDQVAFVVQHVPLSRKCNPHVQREMAIHKYACDYARLSLGVWKLKPSKFPEFHDWLMKSEKPPTVFEARKEAMRVAGEAVLLDQNLKADSFRSFAGNSDEVNQLNAGLPVLLTEFGVIRGVPRTREEWFTFLEELLDIKPLSATND